MRCAYRGGSHTIGGSITYNGRVSKWWIKTTVDDLQGVAISTNREMVHEKKHLLTVEKFCFILVIISRKV